MKYRIVKYGEVYVVQEKMLFFWVNVQYDLIDMPMEFHSLEAAEEYVTKSLKAKKENGKVVKEYE